MTCGGSPSGRDTGEQEQNLAVLHRTVDANHSCHNQPVLPQTIWKNYLSCHKLPLMPQNFHASYLSWHKLPFLAQATFPATSYLC